VSAGVPAGPLESDPGGFVPGAERSALPGGPAGHRLPHRPGRRAGRKPAGRRETCARYLTSNEDYLHYDEALASGWPIATGVIEGAARHLIGDRLGIAGSRWGIEGAEAILRLCAVIDNGDFEAYWQLWRIRHNRHYEVPHRSRTGIH